MIGSSTPTSDCRVMFCSPVRFALSLDPSNPQRCPHLPKSVPPSLACRAKNSHYLSGIDLLPHATRPEGPDHILCEEVMGEAQLDGADCIQAVDLCLGELHLD